MESILIFCLFLLCSIEVLSSPLDGNSQHWTLDSNIQDHVILYPSDVEVEPTFNPLTDIQYLLFTRRNPIQGQRITFDMVTVLQSHWNPDNEARFLIHGHNSGPTASINILIRDQLLANADHNVIVVDWSAGSNTALFATARNRVATAGVAIANYIDELHRALLINFGNIHLIGHNLGAHVAGNTGKSVTRGKIQAIFGLDPAGNSFTSSDTDRLAITDAVYTEAIHTNAGGNGFSEPITRAAFYPNWGSSQPGCGIDFTGNCAHERSILFYAESITSNRFVARQCSGYQQIVSRNCPGIGSGIMGGDSVKNLSGVFYLATNSASPFARN